MKQAHPPTSELSTCCPSNSDDERYVTFPDSSKHNVALPDTPRPDSSILHPPNLTDGPCVIPHGPDLSYCQPTNDMYENIREAFNAPGPDSAQPVPGNHQEAKILNHLKHWRCTLYLIILFALIGSLLWLATYLSIFQGELRGDCRMSSAGKLRGAYAY